MKMENLKEKLINETLNKDRFPSQLKQLEELGANNNLIKYLGNSSEWQITSEQLIYILVMVYKDIKNNK